MRIPLNFREDTEADHHLIVAVSKDETTSYGIHRGRLPGHVMVTGNGIYWLGIQNGSRHIVPPNTWNDEYEAIMFAEMCEYQRVNYGRLPVV